MSNDLVTKLRTTKIEFDDSTMSLLKLTQTLLASMDDDEIVLLVRGLIKWGNISTGDLDNAWVNS